MLILRIENNLQALEKIAYSNNWITSVLLLMFFSIVLLKLIDSKRLKGNFFNFFSVNYIESETEDKTGFFDVFQIVIFVFSMLVLSLLTFNFKEYKLEVILKDLPSFLSVFFSLTTYFLIKRTLEYLFSLLFLIKDEVRFFIISKYSYLYTISLLLYIAIVLSQYASLKQVYLFCFAAFLFVLRFVFHVVINKKLIFSELFYFILYFCAFEIAPLFILFKLMS